MTKTVSPAQLLANQQNAQKSTGPRTPEGKARSAANSLRHGLYARSVLLHGPRTPDEDADFDAILNGLYADFAPSSQIERALVEKIAGTLWRSRRAQRYEAASLSRSLNSDSHDTNVAQARADRLQKELDEHNTGLANMRKAQHALNNPPDEKDEKACEEFSLIVLGLAGRFDIEAGDDKYEDQVLEAVKKTLDERIFFADFWSTRLEYHINKAKREALTAAPSPTEADMLPEKDLHGLIRYENMLDRQFHRDLNQLLGHRKTPLKFVLYDLRNDDRDCRPRSAGDGPSLPPECLPPYQGGIEGGQHAANFSSRDPIAPPHSIDNRKSPIENPPPPFAAPSSHPSSTPAPAQSAPENPTSNSEKPRSTLEMKKDGTNPSVRQSKPIIANFGNFQHLSTPEQGAARLHSSDATVADRNEAFCGDDHEPKSNDADDSGRCGLGTDHNGAGRGP